MLVRVEVLSLLELQPEVKRDEPKALVGPRPDRCGTEPALSLDNKVELLELVGGGGLGVVSAGDVEGGLKGLVDGVGLEVLDNRDW